MAQQTNPPSLLKKVRDKFRYGLVFLVLRDYLKKLRIEITPFYWMKETIPDKMQVQLEDDLKDYEFLFFGPEEIAAVRNLPELDRINKDYITNLVKEGKRCYGAKYKGEITAFSWFDLDKSCTRFYPVQMKNNEVYLFYMYVVEAFRGKNIAPVLRYKLYSILKDMGRDTGYSVTESFNTPSLKFKEKLKAQYVFLGLYVNFFKKYERRWILRKY